MGNLPAKGQNGFLRWLGRQVGYVARAVKTDVSESSNTIYRRDEVKELPHPNDPDLKLRRTVIDEVIKKKEEEK
ncbi:MAG TPA: hypothetical protein VMD30_02700 [Tepidisphaeraceae bacterium]|nr:hypothetical protein [Tepidisphaeraceae bacterium]